MAISALISISHSPYRFSFDFFPKMEARWKLDPIFARTGRFRGVCVKAEPERLKQNFGKILFYQKISIDFG